MATSLQFAHENEAVDATPQERQAVRIMVGLFFSTFWLIVFTGAIRKWVLPGVSVMYLLQDVPLLLAYAYALWSGLYQRTYLMLGILLLSTLLILQGMAQVVFSGVDLFVAVVGVHNYIMYFPMLFIFPMVLTQRYRQSFIRWNLYLSIPMCLLAIAQGLSPKSSFINRTSEGDAFGLPGADVARVSGTFNFTVFYGVWVALAVALCMGEWLVPKERRSVKSQWMLIICTMTVNLCHLVSASRSAIALAGASILGCFIAAILLRSGRAILTLGAVVVFLPLAAGLTYLISPSEYNIVLDRFTGSNYVEDGKTRIIDGFIGFATIPEFSVLGAGIGMGVDASHVGSNDSYNFTYKLSENDMIRTVMELGTPVGLTYALSRIFFIFGMFFLAVRIVRSGSTPHVLPLATFLLAQSYQGDWTRAATMTASQIMLGYAFILSAYYNPDNLDSTTSVSSHAGQLLTESV